MFEMNDGINFLALSPFKMDIVVLEHTGFGLDLGLKVSKFIGHYSVHDVNFIICTVH